MSLLKVSVNGKSFIVESKSKATARSWGANKLEVTVDEATADDITNFITEGGTIEKLAAAEKKAKAPAADPAAEPSAEPVAA